ncbi:MAG: hypothetical protein WC427_03220 [Candidatus Paceibacterota bacterium]
MENKKNSLVVLIICLILILGTGSYWFFNQLTANQTKLIENNKPVEELNNDFDIKIIDFLKQNLAWKNNSNAQIFCAYEHLGETENEIYLKVLCESFYVHNKETICPDSETGNQCFVYQKCENCEIKTIDPRLIQDSGISIPVKLVKKDNYFEMFIPSDGSLYDKTLREIFPAEIIEKMRFDKIDLQDIIISQAEKYFQTKAFFEIFEKTDYACEKNSDCSDKVGDYALLSKCPAKAICLEKKCTIGCYDFINHEELPIIK